MRRPSGRAFLIALLTASPLVCGAGESAAQSGSPAEPGEPASGRAHSTAHWELDFGYGYGLDISSDATSVEDVRFAAAQPRLGHTLGRPFARGSWRQGRAQLLAELPLLLSLEPERGYAAGLSLLARYVLTGRRALLPFVEIGAGPLYLDFNNERNQSDGLSFTLQGGAGLGYFFAPGWAVTWRAHFHHVSNAGLRKPNPGINGLLFTLGLARHGT